MDRIEEVKKILTGESCKKIEMNLPCNYEVDYQEPNCIDCQAKQIDALYSVDGDLREKIAETVLHYLYLCKKRDDYTPAIVEPELTASILQMIAEAGYVKLAENQELPPIPSFTYDKQADIPLLKRGAINYSKLLSGWRKTDEF